MVISGLPFDVRISRNASDGKRERLPEGLTLELRILEVASGNLKLTGLCRYSRKGSSASSELSAAVVEQISSLAGRDPPDERI